MGNFANFPPDSDRWLSPDAFAGVIVGRMSEGAEAPVDSSTITARADNGEESRLTVRGRGAFVLGLELVNPETGRPQHVLYAAEDITTPKLTASHAMSPVGPSDGLGGQHGTSRWSNYVLHPMDDGDTIATLMAEPEVPGVLPQIARRFDLSPRRLIVANTLRAVDMPKPVQTSLGGHDYYRLESGDVSRLVINTHPIEQLLGAKALQAIEAGRPYLWRGYNGSARVDLPDGQTRVQISAKARLNGGQANLNPTPDMLIWRRAPAEGITPYICFEPVIGVTADPDGNLLGNQGITLQANTLSKATLQVTTELLPSRYV